MGAARVRRGVARLDPEAAAPAPAIGALGWMDVRAYLDAAQRAAREQVAAPLACFGIFVDEEAFAATP